MAKIIAIVGRPNVGKSTLFNRLTGSRDAIVESTSGVTRDRHYGKVLWNGVSLTIADTGGYIEGSDDSFETEIRKQVLLAIEEADVVLFMVDMQTGITDVDDSVSKILKKSKRKVYLVVNKVDTPDKQIYSSEFFRLGLGEPFSVSATNGSGTGDLLDELTKDMPKDDEDFEERSDVPRIAIVGRPNVGKSSFLNAILGKDRNIVTPVSGTTRDTIDVRFNAYGFDFVLLDTAGMRKRSKVHEDIEYYSVLRSVRAIESSDVCLVMLDASEGLNKQDLQIFYTIEKNNKGVVVLVNKWDLIEKETQTTKLWEREIREKLAPFSDVPILFISVLNKQRVIKGLEKAMVVFENRTKRITTAKLNSELLPLIEDNPPPSVKGKRVRIKYITQLPTHYPSFAFFCNLPQYVKDPYKRFLENKLREIYDFEGVPVTIHLRKK